MTTVEHHVRVDTSHDAGHIITSSARVNAALAEV